jgi:hypothetical protein
VFDHQRKKRQMAQELPVWSKLVKERGISAE